MSRQALEGKQWADPEEKLLLAGMTLLQRRFYKLAKVVARLMGGSRYPVDRVVAETMGQLIEF